MPRGIELLNVDPATVADASDDHVWLGADTASRRAWFVDDAGNIYYMLTEDAAAAGYQPLIAYAANQFGARASTGAYEAKPISDAALALVSQATQDLIRTVGAGLTAVGNSVSQTATPGAVSFYQINTNGTITVNDAAAQRTAMGLGSAAVEATGTSGHVLGFLDAINTFSTDQNFLGTVRIGTTSTPSGLSGSLLIAGSWTAYSEAASLNNDAVTYSSGSGAHCAAVRMRRARNTAASPAVVVVNDDLGQLIAQGHDGTSFVSAARILIEAEGTIATGIVQGRASIATANASGTLIEGFRFNSSQNLGLLNNLYVGSLTTTPTARIHCAAGTTTLAPQQYTSGTKTTTAVAGEICFDGDLTIAKASNICLSVGGALDMDNFASVGNVGTGVDTLYSETLLGNTLGVSGAKVYLTGGGVTTADAVDTRQITMTFGGNSVFTSGALVTTTAAEWSFWATVMRDSSSSVRIVGLFSISGISSTTVTIPIAKLIAGVTLSSNQTILITGESAGVSVSANDVIAYMLEGSYLPHGVL